MTCGVVGTAFQFQPEAIKTWEGGYVNDPDDLFQFQPEAIKTVTGFDHEGKWWSFNSSQKRLRLWAERHGYVEGEVSIPARSD